MASIWKHPKSRYWTACYRDVSGHQRRASTKETNRKRAQRIADEYEKASRSKRTLKQVQTVLDRLHEELSGARIVRTTVRSRVASWLATKKPETAPATLYFYRNSLGKFLDFLFTWRSAKRRSPVPLLRCQIWGELVRFPDASQNSRTDPRPESRRLASSVRRKGVAPQI